MTVAFMAARGSAEVVVSCGFESVGDSWVFSPVGGIFNTSSGPADSPANQRILSGSQSWLVSGTTSTLTSSEVLLSGWTGVTVQYRLSSTILNGGPGNTSDNQVSAYVATTTYADQKPASFNPAPDITVTGWGSGATWGYDSNAPPQVVSAGSTVTLHPADGGYRTVDGFTDFRIQVPDGKRSLALKIYATTSQNNCWNIDDILVTGTRTNSNDRYWDANGSGAVGGGSGVWDNSSATRWASDESGASHFAWNGANGDNARFSQSGGTVTIGSGKTVAARSLTFTADGYTITADDLASKLALCNGGAGGPGPNTIDVVNAGQTATINARIVGNVGVGLTKTGAGTLVLGGANAYTGATAIDAGVLSVAASSNLGAVGSRVSFDGGTLRLTAPVDLKGNHPCTIQSGGGVINTGNHACAALTSGWSGSGTLTKLGAGTLRLDGVGAGFSGVVALQQGTLQLAASQTLAGCSLIDVGIGATLDVAGITGGYSLGADGRQTLKGGGTVLGSLQIEPNGVHAVGDSPGVQQVRGDYTMSGLLDVEVSGAAPGNGVAGYDQVLVDGSGTNDVLLGGDLAISWSGTGWSSAGDRLWIVRNDTDGALSGTFRNYPNGATVGDYDGCSWQIFYGVDLNSPTEQLVAGNDVVLTPAAPVPEPTSALLATVALLAVGLMRRRLLARR